MFHFRILETPNLFSFSSFRSPTLTSTPAPPLSLSLSDLHFQLHLRRCMTYIALVRCKTHQKQKPDSRQMLGWVFFFYAANR